MPRFISHVVLEQKSSGKSVVVVVVGQVVGKVFSHVL
jgi:hypothetical protein